MPFGLGFVMAQWIAGIDRTGRRRRHYVTKDTRVIVETDTDELRSPIDEAAKAEASPHWAAPAPVDPRRSAGIPQGRGLSRPRYPGRDPHGNRVHLRVSANRPTGLRQRHHRVHTR